MFNVIRGFDAVGNILARSALGVSIPLVLFLVHSTHRRGNTFVAKNALNLLQRRVPMTPRRPVSTQLPHNNNNNPNNRSSSSNNNRNRSHDNNTPHHDNNNPHLDHNNKILKTGNSSECRPYVEISQPATLAWGPARRTPFMPNKLSRSPSTNDRPNINSAEWPMVEGGALGVPPLLHHSNSTVSNSRKEVLHFLTPLGLHRVRGARINT